MDMCGVKGMRKKRDVEQTHSCNSFLKLIESVCIKQMSQ